MPQLHIFRRGETQMESEKGTVTHSYELISTPNNVMIFNSISFFLRTKGKGAKREMCGQNLQVTKWIKS